MIDRYDDNKVKQALKNIWNYMKLNQDIEKCDLIIGCGCANLDIPVKCSELYKQGFAPKILFAGGYGKITKNSFNKTEAEIYKEIAIANGVNEADILIETESTNTGDNFKFAEKILDKYNIKHDRIIIVDKSFKERRSYSAAKIVFQKKKLMVTTPDMTFDEYLDSLSKKKNDEIIDIISVIVGDVQRIIIYPQFGWQTENEVPEMVLKSYYYLKEIGFSKYILSKNDIKLLIEKNGISKEKKENYFN